MRIRFLCDVSQFAHGLDCHHVVAAPCERVGVASGTGADVQRPRRRRRQQVRHSPVYLIEIDTPVSLPELLGVARVIRLNAHSMLLRLGARARAEGVLACFEHALAATGNH